MNKPQLGMLAVAAIALCCAGDVDARKWSDMGGKSTIEAEFLGLAEGEVTLKRDDGEEIKIPLKRLSVTDRAFVARMVKTASKEKRIDNPVRVWTDILGRKIEAQLVDVGDGTVSLRIREGRVLTAPFFALSKEDQEFVSMKTEEVASADPRTAPTHKQIAAIPISGVGTLRTFCVNLDGNLLVGVGGDEEVYVRSGEGYDVQIVSRPAEIRVISPDGKAVARWKSYITPKALCVGKDGTVYVGGGGKLGKIDSNGVTFQTAASPSYVEATGAKWQPSDGPNPASSPAPKGKQPSGKKSASDPVKSGGQQELAAKLEGVARSKTDITSIAVTEQELFVACKAKTGYAVYAMDHDFRRPRKIASNLSGCCGQMDIKANGSVVFAAENSRHRVDCFDRNGRQLFSFGRNDRKSIEGFGSCCNPMNLRFGAGGDLYTAESGLGRIKRYTPQGKFLEVVATVRVAGGCKHIAIDVSPDGARMYMLNLGGSEIVVLAKRDATKANSEDGTSSKKH